MRGRNDLAGRIGRWGRFYAPSSVSFADTFSLGGACCVTQCAAGKGEGEATSGRCGGSFGGLVGEFWIAGRASDVVRAWSGGRQASPAAQVEGDGGQQHLGGGLGQADVADAGEPHSVLQGGEGGLHRGPAA